MTSITFQNGTIIPASWLNDVDEAVYTTLPSVQNASGVTYTPAGTGAVPTTVQAKLRESVSVLDFGADPTGVADSTTEIQAAIDAMSTGSEITIPAGTYLISDTITISKSVCVHLYGTLKPYSNPSTQRPMFSITADNVTIDGHGVGGFDGISSTYNNFDAVWAFGTAAAGIGLSGYLTRTRIVNCVIKNMGLQSTASSTILFQAVDKGEISNISASNIGKTDAFVNSAGPYFFYGEFNRNLLIDNVVCNSVGNTFISLGASLNDTVRNCSGSDVTLFPYKAGFGGPGHAVTSDVTPAQSNQGIVFSIANTDYAKARFARGMHFVNVSDLSVDIAEGTVESQGDYGSYLVITTTAPMNLPSVGNVMLEMSSGCLFDGCKAYYSGLEGYDLNMMYGLTIDKPYIRGAGMLRIGGNLCTISPLVSSGIWVGADTYSGNVNVHSTGVTITGADIECCYGSGIQIDAQPRDVVIDNYRIYEIGIGTDLTQTITPVSYGISINLYAANRCQRVEVGKGTIYTYRGGGVRYNYCNGGYIKGAIVTAPTGFDLSACNSLWTTDCQITATAALDQMWGVKYHTPGPSGGQNYITNNAIYISATTITGGATTAFGIMLDSSITQPEYIQPGNRISSGVTSGTFTTVGGAGVGNAVYTNQTLP